jgi:large-conductance mechanosensitive channel
MNREKALETIIVLAFASLIASLWLHVGWLIYVSIGLLAISFISKRLTALIGKGWLSFSNYLGVVMNYVLMFIIFYIFLSPLSFFQRLGGKNQILKKGKEDSHFYKRNHLYTKKDIENPW